MADYSEQTVAMRQLMSRVEEALRRKQFARADKLVAQIMHHGARLHGCIHSLDREEEAYRKRFSPAAS